VLIPLILNPVPLTLACEIVTLAVPEFIRVIVCELLLATTTLPKATLPGFVVNIAFAATPLPDKASACGEPGALSVNAMLPVAPPATEGVNCTLNEVLWPAPSVIGVVNPLMPKPDPETCARLMARFTFPLFVSFTLWVLVWPTVTLPRLIDAGEVVKFGCVPVPVIEIVSGELDASLTTVRVPVSTPVASGAN